MGIVIFTSNHSLERAENLRAVYDAYDGEKEFWCIHPGRPLPDYHSGKYSLRVADELPNDSPGKCLFIGHGMGAGKTYGLDQPNGYFSRPDLITYAIASSVEMIPLVAGQCGISESQVIPLGMPRTDIFFQKTEKNEGPYKCHLYAPTFRDRNSYTSWYPDWNIVSKQMPKDHRMLVKPHMWTGTILTKSDWDNIETRSSEAPTEPILMAVDTLITDYSSIAFDMYVLRKPVILFAKDKDRYIRERGLYLSYPEMYSPYYFEREEEMCECLGYAEWDDSFEALRTYYTGACDGHSVERTLDVIRSLV